MVHTNGDSIFRVDLGAGNDVAYTDNSGTNGANFNDGRATFVFNAVEAWNHDGDDGTTALVHNIDDLQSDANETFIMLGSTLAVNFLGYTATADITSYTTTDLQINNMIKDIIQNDEHLSDVIVAEDGPGNTLVIRSLIDGEYVDGAFNVSIAAGDAEFYDSLSVAQITLFNSVTGGTAGDGAEVRADVLTSLELYNDGALTDDTATVFGEIAFEQTDADTETELDGGFSVAVTENTTTDGTGNDTIVLSTGNSAETVVLVADGETDVIFNLGEDDTIVFGEIEATDGLTLIIGGELLNADGSEAAADAGFAADDAASVDAFLEYFNAEGSAAADAAAEGDNLFSIIGDDGNVTNFVVSVNADGVATGAEDYGMLIVASLIV
jgi:hypothetical protein